MSDLRGRRPAGRSAASKSGLDAVIHYPLSLSPSLRPPSLSTDRAGASLQSRGPNEHHARPRGSGGEDTFSIELHLAPGQHKVLQPNQTLLSDNNIMRAAIESMY